MKWFEAVILAGVSSVVGGLIGWFAARERFKVDYDLACADFERKQRDEYDKFVEAVKSKDSSEPERIVRSEDTKPDLRELAAKYQDKDLDRFVAEREHPEDDEPEDEEDEDDLDEPIDIDRESPYIITTREFEDDKRDYDKIYMSFYRDDEVLVEDDFLDTPIYNGDDILGPHALSMFGWDDDEGDNVVCVRNDDKHTDYYVSLIPGLYSELVAGIKDPIERRRTHDRL